MSIIKWFAPAFLAGAFGLAFGEDQAKPAATEELAKQLVDTVARVKEGDVVVISGEARDADLLESLRVHSAKAGADAMISLTASPATSRRLLLEVPEKLDKRTSALGLKLAEIATVTFSIDSTDYAAMKDLPPERLQARSEAALPITQKHLARNVRQVSIGNGMYPTESNAKTLGLTKEELTAIFRAGMAVDYEALQKTAAAMKAKLSGQEISITSPSGTKLTVGIEPNASNTSDGVISDEKIKAGGAATIVYLPAGEVFTRTKSGTASGKVVLPSWVFEGELITDLTLIFEKGKLTSIAAKPGKGFDRLMATYKAAGEGKDQLTVIDVGVNSAVKFPKAARDVAYPTGGVVTVCVGGDLWAGGSNKSQFGISAMLREATLSVDGKNLVVAGEMAK